MKIKCNFFKTPTFLAYFGKGTVITGIALAALGMMPFIPEGATISAIGGALSTLGIIIFHKNSQKEKLQKEKPQLEECVINFGHVKAHILHYELSQLLKDQKDCDSIFAELSGLTFNNKTVPCEDVAYALKLCQKISRVNPEISKDLVLCLFVLLRNGLGAQWMRVLENTFSLRNKTETQSFLRSLQRESEKSPVSQWPLLKKVLEQTQNHLDPKLDLPFVEIGLNLNNWRKELLMTDNSWQSGKLDLRSRVLAKFIDLVYEVRKLEMSSKRIEEFIETYFFLFSKTKLNELNARELINFFEEIPSLLEEKGVPLAWISYAGQYNSELMKRDSGKLIIQLRSYRQQRLRQKAGQPPFDVIRLLMIEHYNGHGCASLD